MFETYDFDYLVEEMLSNVSDDLDKREGSVIYDAVAPIALALANYYIALDMALNESFADSASYYYLAKRAAERGIFPYEETYAICKMKVTPTDIVIQAGERFNLDELNYSVVEPVEGEAGAYRIQCETAGVAGNQQKGTLLPIEYVEGLESAEITEILIPGEEEEDVESFRERYFATFNEQAFGGNRADYIDKVTSIDGVGTCKVIRMWEKGYNPADFIPSAAVKSWVEQQTDETPGKEVNTWLQKVYTAASEKLLTVGGTVKIVFVSSELKAPSAELVTKVQTELDPEQNAGEGYGTAPIGHVVNVVGAKETKINYEFAFAYDRGHSFAELKSSIESVIDSYHEQLRQSWAQEDTTVIRANQLETLILAIGGIADITSTKMNGQTASLTLEYDCIPVRGEISEQAT